MIINEISDLIHFKNKQITAGKKAEVYEDCLESRYTGHPNTMKISILLMCQDRWV